MATAACGTFQLRHGSFPPLRSTSASRGTAARSICVGSGAGSALSSDVHCVNSGGSCENRARRMVSARAMTDDRVEMDENPEGIISGEWPENFSLLCYDDLRVYLETQIFDEDVRLFTFSLYVYAADQLNLLRLTRTRWFSMLFQQIKRPSVLLGDVMSTTIRAAIVDQTLEEIDYHFEFVSGLPVIDHELRCIGIISKKDKDRALNGVSIPY